MELKVKVHGVNHTSIPMSVDAGGQTVIAQVPALEVELVALSEISGSWTLRFYGKELAEAEKTFKQDAVIPFTTPSLAPAPAPVPVTKA